MASAWGELKRRNVVKVAMAYAIVGWLLVEVSSTVFPVLQLREWTVTLFVVERFLLDTAGPFAGADIDPASLDVVLDESPSATAEPTPATAAGAQREDLPDSVAVLPFDNLSPDPSDAYFAAGLHDEILSQLAKLRNLSVISRTSVSRYEDSDLSIPEIARELNVETGSRNSTASHPHRHELRLRT